jgi:hypothetical protein
MPRILPVFVSILVVMLLVAAPGKLRAADSAKAADAPAEAVYLRLDRIVVPVIRDGVVEQHITFVLVLELADERARMKAKELLPRLTDSFVRDLHILASRPRTASDGVDLGVAKRHLLGASVRLLGADAVKDVLIQRTMTRPVG